MLVSKVFWNVKHFFHVCEKLKKALSNYSNLLSQVQGKSTSMFVLLLVKLCLIQGQSWRFFFYSHTKTVSTSTSFK